MSRPYGYPGFIPPWQDGATLCAHLCISEGTLDNWVRQGILPEPRKVGGKRMWKWADVETRLSGDATLAPGEVDAARIFNDTKAASGG